MAFKNLVMKLRQTILCCNKRERKSSLDIGSPTNVRRVDISDALPGLTDAERKYIREKASSDAIHLLGLRSYPPSRPQTSPPSPTSSPSHSLARDSAFSSREPSEALLNAASKDLPTTLPTPPRRTHNEHSPPAARMKSMRSNATDEIDSKSFHSNTPHGVMETVEKGMNESIMTLNLDFDWDEKKSRADSTRTLSITEGFEMQDTTGGASQTATPVKTNKRIESAVKATALGDSSDSEEDTFVSRETKPLVGV